MHSRRSPRTRACALALLVLYAAHSPSAPAQTPAPRASVASTFEKEGIAVEFELTPTPGAREDAAAVADAAVTFRVKDARTKQPLTVLRPGA